MHLSQSVYPHIMVFLYNSNFFFFFFYMNFPFRHKTNCMEIYLYINEPNKKRYRNVTKQNCCRQIIKIWTLDGKEKKNKKSVLKWNVNICSPNLPWSLNIGWRFPSVCKTNKYVLTLQTIKLLRVFLCCYYSLKNALMFETQVYIKSYTFWVALYVYLFVQAAVDRLKVSLQKFPFILSISLFLGLLWKLHAIFQRVEWNIRCWSFHLYVSGFTSVIRWAFRMIGEMSPFSDQHWFSVSSNSLQPIIVFVYIYAYNCSWQKYCHRFCY